MKKLTDKQEKFCNEYLIDLNATQAAIRSGYSPKTSQVISTENLSKPIIQERIAELKAIRAEDEGITPAEVLRELKNFAYSDITETLTLSVDEIKELPIELRRMISSYKQTTTHFQGGHTTLIELKFVDKMKAIEMINRHIGFYEEDNKQSKQDIIINRPSFED